MCDPPKASLFTRLRVLRLEMHATVSRPAPILQQHQQQHARAGARRVAKRPAERPPERMPLTNSKKRLVQPALSVSDYREQAIRRTLAPVMYDGPLDIVVEYAEDPDWRNDDVDHVLRFTSVRVLPLTEVSIVTQQKLVAAGYHTLYDLMQVLRAGVDQSSITDESPICKLWRRCKLASSSEAYNVMCTLQKYFAVVIAK